MINRSANKIIDICNFSHCLDNGGYMIWHGIYQVLDSFSLSHIYIGTSWSFPKLSCICREFCQVCKMSHKCSIYQLLGPLHYLKIISDFSEQFHLTSIAHSSGLYYFGGISYDANGLKQDLSQCVKMIFYFIGGL